MPVYVVGQLRVRNWDWLKEYAAKTAMLIARHNGKYLARGLNARVLEGDAEPPSAIVVLEFPTEADARAWHQDPEYLPMIELRRTGCDTDLVLADSLPS